MKTKLGVQSVIISDRGGQRASRGREAGVEAVWCLYCCWYLYRARLHILLRATSSWSASRASLVPPALDMMTPSAGGHRAPPPHVLVMVWPPHDWY